MKIKSRKNNLVEAGSSYKDESENKKIFSRSRAELENDLQTVIDEAGSEACEHTPRCVEAKFEVELYKAECDNAGAFKFKRFTRKMSEAFLNRDFVSEVGKNGEPVLIPQELAQTRYLFISMGELDRLNKQGHSQSAGDAGLEALVSSARHACTEVLGEEMSSKIDIFRYGGNEFVVELPDVTSDQVSVIEGIIVNGKLKLKNFENVEAPPVSIYTTDLNEVASIVAGVETLEAESLPSDPVYFAQKTIDVMSREVDYNLEVKKFVTRIDRAVEKIEAVNEGRLSRKDAEDLFNDFLRKGFHGSGLNELKDVEDLWKNGTDHQDFERVTQLLAVGSARARFAADRKFRLYEEFLVNKRFLELSRSLDSRGESERLINRLDDGQKLAKIPRLTRGLAALETAEENLQSRTGTEWERSARLAYRIEVAKRDRGTGFLERGQFYEDWIKQVDENDKHGKQAAVIFIDMGFLKYFNDAGGRGVGDAALRKAAELMEQAIHDAGVNGTPYRYGGDEFAIRLSGGREEAGKIVAELKKLRDGAGRIPDLSVLRESTGDAEIVGESRFDYAPTELVFNTGIAEVSDVTEIVNDLREADQLEAILINKNMTLVEFKAELVVKLADASVGYEKATSRFHILIDLINNPAYRDKDSAYHARVESIIGYSQKAIFSNAAGNEALRLFADLAGHESTEDINRRIDAFVADRITKLKELVHGEKEITDKLIEVHSARNRLLAQLTELKSELSKKDEIIFEEHQRIQELGLKLEDAEKARLEIIEARKKIG